MRAPVRGMTAAALVALVALAPAGADRVLAADAAPQRTGSDAGVSTASVSYVAGGSVYLDAGREQGLAPGDSAQARRSGRLISGLLVREVTGRRAVCDTFAVVAMPAVGDAVRYRRRASSAPAAEAAADSASGAQRDDSPDRRARRSRTWRGRVAIGFLGVDPEGGGRMQQPTLDLRLDRIGRGLNLQADVRGRSTNVDGANERQARVYRLSATLHDAASRHRITVGRQVLSAAPGAAFFDGAVAELDRGAWTLGLFGGGEPEAATFEPSFDQVQAGAFTRVRRSRAGRTWSATLGVFDARYRGEIDRDALFLDLLHVAPGRSFFFNQEIDVNPKWKRALGDDPVTATSTFLFGRQALGPSLTVQAGFDNRRNVRLARDRETAETSFDDRYRRGGWTGVTWDAARWLRIDGSGRWLSGISRDSRAYTGSVLLWTPRRHDVALRARATRTEGASMGWLRVVEGEWRFAGDRRLLVRYGREEWDGVGVSSATLNHWRGVEIESGLGARIYGFASGEWRAGDGGRSLQSQFGMSWFF